MVFWSICLANLLKNFRWLNYQLKPYFVQGDKSHLYVIQFTRYSSKSPRGDSFSLAYSLPFVKNFFRSFSRNFHAPFWAEFFGFLRCSIHSSSVCVAICLPLSRALGYTITPSPICQHLFSVFSIFFLNAVFWSLQRKTPPWRAALQTVEEPQASPLRGGGPA